MQSSLVFALTLLSTWFLMISAQMGTDFRDNCKCSPDCRPVSEINCNKAHGLLMTREDCPCCQVCTKQVGEKCSPPHEPCDNRAGLACTSAGICQGSCKVDGDCADDLFCVTGICTDPCPLLQPCQGSPKGAICVTKKHRPVCECPKGFISQEGICISTENTTVTSSSSLVSLSSKDAERCELSNNRMLKVGEIFYKDQCSQRCICGPGGRPICGAFQCPIGLFPSGSSRNYRSCVEMRTNHLADECCVVLACAEDFINMTTNNTKTLGNLAVQETQTRTENFDLQATTTLSSEPDRPIKENVNLTTTTLEETTEKDELTTVIYIRSTGSELPDLTTADPPRDMTNSSVNTTNSALVERNLKLNSRVTSAITVDNEHVEKPRKTLNKFSSKSAVILVQSSSQNSTTVIVPSSAGGILHYKKSHSDIETSKITVERNQLEATLKGLNPSTKYTLKWVGNDGSLAKTEIKTEDGCRHNSISYMVGAKWHEGCQTTCSCHIGGISECRPRCIFVAGAIKKDQCVEVPSPSDPECCVEYNCEKGDNSVLGPAPQGNGLGGGSGLEPKLIVTSRSHNSVTVAWDDFRADDPSSVYVTEYRQVPEELSIEIPWMKRETLRGQPPPTMTLKNLKPNTLYQVRVGIYSDAGERKLNAATETITVRTEPGCVYGNTSFPVGEFFQGCEERCACATDGSVKCSERCSIPYFRKSSFSNDPLCTEEQADEDNCCVLVMCAHGDTISGVEGDYDQCANTVCGKNAECVSWPTLTEASSGAHALPQPGSCRCIDGFSGDPNDLETGCGPDPEAKNESNSCKFKSTFYSPNDVFYDGCSYICTCNKKIEIECQPRCKYPVAEKMTEDETSSCTFEIDPKDSCCRIIRNCNSTADDEPDVGSPMMQTPSLGFDGCTIDNKTYAKDEKFSFGCDSKCLCMGFGDVSCSPRCPPTKEIPKKEGIICETLLDPDDSCCNVTVCDTVAPEVMKAGVSENILDEILITDSKSTTTEKSEETTAMTTEQPTTTVVPSVSEKRLRFEDVSSSIEILEILPVDSSVVKLQVHVSADILQEFLSSPNESLTVSYSHDSLVWTNRTVPVDDVQVFDMYNLVFSIPDLEAYDAYQFKVSYKGVSSPMKKAALTASSVGTSEGRASSHGTCEYKGKFYEPGDAFHDGCIRYCQCTEKLQVHCGMIECPKDFGLDILDPGCLEWDVDPDYVPTPPKCCDEKPQCTFHMNALSCSHGGHNFQHLDFIPKEMVACDQRCQCISGNLDCEELCSPVQATPPFNLPCSPIEIRLVTQPTYPCCSEWQCVNSSVAGILHPLPPSVHPNIHGSHINLPGPPAPPPGISMPRIELVTENSASLTFSIPKTFVGLPGGLYLRFTDDILTDPNPLDWESEVIHEDGIPLDQSKWQYTKTNLVPGSNYSMQVSLSSHLNKAEIVSPLFAVATQQGETRLLDVDVELSVNEITNSSARISWREFTSREMSHINAIQIRYWSKNVQIPHKGPLLHIEASSMTLRELSPGTEYIVDLVIMSHPNSPVIISSKENLTFKTLSADSALDLLPRLDLDAELSVSDIKNTSAKISWRHFSNLELRYIDGTGVRFWSGKKRFPQEGPMLHREADNMILRDLQPDTKYAVDLFFIPHAGLSSSISNTKNISFTTKPKLKDMFAFNITISAGEIEEKGVQILYSGVSEPEGKYVNVYRVVYTSDGDSSDSQKFKVPKNRKDGFVLLTDLRRGVHYEVWLEAYLTNGGRKKSNVISVTTDLEGVHSDSINEIAESKELVQDEIGNYYSAFVAVAILVAIACLIIIILLFVLMRRTNHAKAHISKGTAAAYDNPSYKTSENPNYAIEMNGLKNTTNGSSIPPEEP